MAGGRVPCREEDMTASLHGIGAITLFVDDLDRSKAWYRSVFDLPVAYEDDVSAVIKFDNTLVNLLMVPAAHELIAPAVVAAPETGSRCQLTIWVDDADAVCAELHERGVALVNGPMNREWRQRTACFSDPDGHIWEIAQTLS
jgi:catechol 2,3-dioxygenase-like lactoylglutathione lyase family enzyme